MAKVVNTSSYKGKRTPKNLENGPIRRHGCTDIICLVIFLAFWAGMVMVAIYSYHYGDPQALVAPYDQFGNPCGLNAQQNYSYILFIKTGENFNLTNTVCIKACPQNKSSTIECAPDYLKNGQECSKITPYPTISYVGRVCVPSDPNDYKTLSSGEAFALNLLFQVGSDFDVGWWMICVVGLIGIFLGFVYIVFMRFCSGVVTWGLLVLYELVLIIFGAICALDSMDVSLAGDITPKGLSQMNPLTLKIIAGCCIFVAIVSLILICIFREKIKLAVAVLQAAEEFVQDNLSTLILPPFFFVISLMFYIFWVFTLMYLMGTNDISPSPNNLPFASVQWERKAEYLMAFMIIALIWNHAFFHAIQQFVVSSATVLWYFRRAQKHRHPIALSIVRSLLHLGSIALGSIMVGILDYVRMFMKLFEGMLNNAKNNKDHCCSKYCTSCYQGCLACFDGCLKFIDKHAYVQIAMTGKGFCAATQDAFYLILRHALQYGSIHGLGSIFLFFGQVFITFLSTLAGYLIITKATYFQENLFSPVVLTVFFGLVSLIVGHAFMSIYGVAADTIIHCFAMDEEVHDEWAKYAPEAIVDLTSRNRRQKLLSESASLNQSKLSEFSQD